MPVPDFQNLMLPILETYADEGEISLADVRKKVAKTFNLTNEDLQMMLPSGRQSIFANRVGWAVKHMERAKLLKRIRRGIYLLTQDGGKLLACKPSRIDLRRLRKYPAYANWTQTTGVLSPGDETAPTQDQRVSETPEESLIDAMRNLNSILHDDLLHRVRDAEPAFLERVVVELLSAMGYGGGDIAMAQVTGQTGDHGIDGTIKEDALGLDEVYVQTKRYAEGNNVGEGDLRNFAGAIDAAGTTKGVFVTTSGFTRAAEEYVKRSPKRIILINGVKLASLMIKHGIGVRTQEVCEIKRIDDDYFDQDML